MIPWSILSQVPPGLSPFPPFLPPLRAARQPASTSLRRAPTSARLPDSPGSPKSGSRHHCARDAPALGRLSRHLCSRRAPGVRDAERVLTALPPIPAPPQAAPPTEAPSRPRVPGPTRPRAAPLRPQPQPGAIGRFPEGQGAGPRPSDGSTDGPRPSPAGPDACLPNRAAGLPRSRAPSPPRLPLRTFRASSGRPRGSARGPRPGLRCASTPEPPAIAIPVAVARQGSDPGPVNSLSGGGQRGSERWAPRAEEDPSGPPTRPRPRPPRQPPAAGPRPLDRVPGTPADLLLARRLPLSGLPLRLRLGLQPRCSWAPPAVCSGTHAVPAPPRCAGRTRPGVRRGGRGGLVEPARKPGDTPSRAWAPACSPRLRWFRYLLQPLRRFSGLEGPGGAFPAL